MADEKLAVFGGPRTVTLSPPKWPAVGDEEIDAVVQYLKRSREDTQFLSSAGGGGPVKEYEERFASFMGSRFAMSTCGGGPALHIAVMAVGVEAGDEVIVSPYTWGQTVSCILNQNAIPVYADIDPRTYNLDAGSIREKITPRTRAIVVVHIYGHPADMDPIMEIARKHEFKVIEDCAQACGARYKGRRVGTIGDIGCFSTGSGKNMIGGEGGVLLTDDRKLYELASLCGQHPARHKRDLTDESIKRYSDSLIYTYRIHPLTCAIAGVQLKYLDKWNDERGQNALRLSEGLQEIQGIEPPYIASECDHVFHMYSPSFVPEQVDGISRETFVRAVAAEGVPISTGYVRTPIYLRPRHQELKYFYGKGCPWTCKFAGRKVAYNEGDCPVCEERCERKELTIGGACSWRGDQSALIDQYLGAFRKVAAQLDEVRALSEHPPSAATA